MSYFESKVGSFLLSGNGGAQEQVKLTYKKLRKLHFCTSECNCKPQTHYEVHPEKKKYTPPVNRKRCWASAVIQTQIQTQIKTPVIHHLGPWLGGVLKSNTCVGKGKETSLCYIDDEMRVLFRRETWVMRINRITMSTLLVQPF